MAEYRWLTIWRIEAPLEGGVYAAILNSLRRPEWWPGVQEVEQVAAGDADGSARAVARARANRSDNV